MNPLKKICLFGSGLFFLSGCSTESCLGVGGYGIYKIIKNTPRHSRDFNKDMEDYEFKGTINGQELEFRPKKYFDNGYEAKDNRLILSKPNGEEWIYGDGLKSGMDIEYFIRKKEDRKIESRVYSEPWDKQELERRNVEYIFWLSKIRNEKGF